MSQETFSPPNIISGDAKFLLVSGISLVMQTFTYGIYVAFFSYAMKISFRRRSVGTMSTLMKYLPICSFVLSTSFWSIHIAEFFRRMQVTLVDLVPEAQRPNNRLGQAQNMFNAVVLLNFLITDCTVVWRAWMICRDITSTRRPLFAAIGTFTLGLLCALTTVALRAFVNGCEWVEGYQVSQRCKGPEQALEITQVLTSGFCLLTNVFATGAVGWRFWVLRRASRSMERVNVTQVAIYRTFDVLVESGFVFGILSIIMLLSVQVKMPVIGGPQLGTFVLPVYVHLSSLYPALILVIVHQQRSASTLSKVVPKHKNDKSLPDWDSESGSSQSSEPLPPHYTYTVDLTRDATDLNTTGSGRESVVHLREVNGDVEVAHHSYGPQQQRRQIPVTDERYTLDLNHGVTSTSGTGLESVVHLRRIDEESVYSSARNASDGSSSISGSEASTARQEDVRYEIVRSPR